MIKQNKTSRLHFILKFEMAAIWIKDFHGIRRVHFVLMGTAARRRLKTCTRQEYQSLDKYLTSCKVSKNVYRVNDCPLSWHIGPQLSGIEISIWCLLSFYHQRFAYNGKIEERKKVGPEDLGDNIKIIFFVLLRIDLLKKMKIYFKIV